MAFSVTDTFSSGRRSDTPTQQTSITATAHGPTGSHHFFGLQGERGGIGQADVYPPAKGRVALPGGVEIDEREVRKAIKARRKRDQFFGAGLFEDPGWDMILELFGAELEGSRVTVSSLCAAAAVAPTTALRWIKNLVDAGLFERDPDPFDRRRAFITLSDRARDQMYGYITDLRRTGVSLG